MKSGCNPRTATFAPAGSNWSSRGGNKAMGTMRHIMELLKLIIYI